MLEEINISAEVIEDKYLAEEANNIILDIEEFAQTSAILTELHKAFGRSAEDYCSSIKDAEMASVMSAIIMSMENSSIICLGRLFDSHVKSYRIENFVGEKFKKGMVDNELTIALCTMFLRSVGRSAETTEALAEECGKFIQELIAEARNKYEKYNFFHLRGSYIGHSNRKVREKSEKIIMEISDENYLDMSMALLKISFTVKFLINPPSCAYDEYVDASSRRVIDDNKQAAIRFIKEAVRL